MRLRSAAARAATTVLGLGVAAAATGRLASDLALRPGPGRPLPSDPPLTVHAVGEREVVLTRSLAALRPGRYGLTGPGWHAVVGPVLDERPHPPDCVVRRLEGVPHGRLRVGAAGWLTPQVHLGNPRDALGLDHADVDVPGDLGALPAWFVPGDRDTWVVTVHGLATTREQPMVIMPFLHRHHFPVLDPAYRGDLGAPWPWDGVTHLGATEWRDLEAALDYAVRYGARAIILHGWSTGATMALLAATHSAQRHRISGLVLDSPVLDWRATVRALAAAHGAPAALVGLAARAAEGQTGLRNGWPTASVPDLPAGQDRSEDRQDRKDPQHRQDRERARRVAGAGHGNGPPELTVPTLVVHGPDDRLAPWDASRALVAAGRGISLHTVRRAPHAAMWNADPDGYEEALRRFLMPLM